MNADRGSSLNNDKPVGHVRLNCCVLSAFINCLEFLLFEVRNVAYIEAS